MKSLRRVVDYDPSPSELTSKIHSYFYGFLRGVSLSGKFVELFLKLVCSAMFE